MVLKTPQAICLQMRRCSPDMLQDGLEIKRAVAYHSVHYLTRPKLLEIGKLTLLMVFQVLVCHVYIIQLSYLLLYSSLPNIEYICQFMCR